MPRVKRGVTTRKKHKRILKSTKGYYAGRGKKIKLAKEAKLHAMKHAQRGRKVKKRDYRSLWIARINNGLRSVGDFTYAAFIHQMSLKNIELDRKTLAYLAVEAPKAFKELVTFVMSDAKTSATNK